MTTPTLALGISAAGAKTVADLAAAVGALKTNLAGLAGVAGGSVTGLDALTKEFREMRQELGATLQGLRTDLAAGMQQAFAGAKAQAKKGADELENEVKKGAVRVRVAGKAVSFGNDISLSAGAQGVGSVAAVSKLLAELKQHPAAIAAAEEATVKQLFSWKAKLQVGSAAIAEAQRLAAEKEEAARLGYRIKLQVGSAKIAEALDKAAAVEESQKLAYRIKMQVGSAKIAETLEQAAMREASQRMSWIAKLQVGSLKIAEETAKAAEREADAKLKHIIKMQVGSAKIAEAAADAARKELENAAKQAAAIDLASRTVEAAYAAADAKGQLRAQIRARAQLDKGVAPGIVQSRFGSGAVVGAAGAPSLGSLKEDLQQLGTSKVLPKFTKELNDAHSAARGLASGFGAMWLTWGNMAPLLAGAALSHSFVQTVKMGAEVQNTMQVIRNLSQETDGAVAGLNAQMMELSRSGPFGPRAVSEAMKTLSLAGLDAEKVGTTIKDVLNFAVAGDTSIEKAADVMTSTATAFGISARGYNYVGDVIAKTAAVSKASVESIGEAFKTASVVNSQYGASLEDVGVGLALLSNIGVKGTAAGTALRNMYVDILGRTPKVQKAFEGIGLSATFAFDKSTGKARSLIDIFSDLDKALSKYDKVSQTRALQDIFSERGGKEAIAVLDALRKKVEDLNKASTAAGGKASASVRSELERMIQEINNANGFMATAAANMTLTPLNQMKSVAASLQTTLVGAFDSLQPYIVATAEKLKSVFNSQEFQTGVRNMVVAVGELTKYIVEHSGALVAMFSLWASFKLASGLTAVIITAAQGFMTLSTAITGTAAATNTLAAAQAGSAAATTASSVATAGKAASLTGLLSVAARFLPYIGAIVLAWQGYTMWTDTASKANKDYAGEHHTALISALRAETDRLHEVNAAKMEGISLDEKRLRKSVAASQGDINAPVELARSQLLSLQSQLATAPTVGSFGKTDRASVIKQIADAERELDRQETLAMSRRMELQGTLNKLEIEARTTKERENAEAAQREKDRIAGMEKYAAAARAAAAKAAKDGKGSNFGEDFVPDNSLAALDTEMRQSTSVIANTYNNRKTLLDDLHKGELVSEGIYQAQSLAAVVKHEAETREVILNSVAQMATAKAAEEDRLKGAFAKQPKELQQRLENLGTTYDKLVGGAAASLEKLTDTTLMRQQRTVIALNSEVKKLVQSNEDYWIKAQAGAAKEEALTKSRIASLSMDEEQRASMDASTRVGEAHAEHVGKLRREYDVAVKDLSDYTSELERNGVVSLEADIRSNALTRQITELAKAIGMSEGSIASLQVRAANNAVLEVQARKYREFSDQLNSQLAASIYDAGKDGGAALRRVLEEQLIRKPFIMVIEAVMKPASDAMTSTILGLVKGAIGAFSGFNATGAGGVSGYNASGGGYGAGIAPSGEYYGSLGFDGGGYTGSGARSGGLDGKGGFMAMLHPQETVVDHYRGQGTGGKTEVVINNYGGPEPQVTETTDSRGNRKVSVTVGDLSAGELRRPGSAMHQANRQAFGTRPVLVRR